MLALLWIQSRTQTSNSSEVGRRRRRRRQSLGAGKIELLQCLQSCAVADFLWDRTIEIVSMKSSAKGLAQVLIINCWMHWASPEPAADDAVWQGFWNMDIERVCGGTYSLRSWSSFPMSGDSGPRRFWYGRFLIQNSCRKDQHISPSKQEIFSSLSSLIHCPWELELLSSCWADLFASSKTQNPNLVKNEC